jgi:hypothetical protein
MTYTQLTPPDQHPRRPVRLPGIALRTALTALVLALFFVLGLFHVSGHITHANIGGLILGGLLLFVLLPIVAVVATLSLVLSVIAFFRHPGNRIALIACLLSFPLGLAAVIFSVKWSFGR